MSRALRYALAFEAGAERAAGSNPNYGSMGSVAQHGSNAFQHSYNREAVNKAIASSNRAGRRIGGREASMIHALLRGRG